jgi:hypothetical protein
VGTKRERHMEIVFRKVFGDEIIFFLPFLDREPLDVDATCTFSRLSLVDNVDARLVVFVDNSGSSRSGESEFTEYRT